MSVCVIVLTGILRLQVRGRGVGEADEGLFSQGDRLLQSHVQHPFCLHAGPGHQGDIDMIGIDLYSGTLLLQH